MNRNTPQRRVRMGEQVTATISVMLVLFILGLVAAINIAFSSVERQVKERMGFTVVLREGVPQASIDKMDAICEEAPYISSYTYMSADDVLAQETASSGQGADSALVEMLGVNPYGAMYDIHVDQSYATVDSINAVMAQWLAMEDVEDVTANTELIGSLNRNTTMLNTVLLVVAAALLLISFVLINNTVRLTVYARRFLIHTMQLVGATDAFIRRPMMVQNMIQGVVAAIMAIGLLIGLCSWTRSWDPAVASVLPWSALIIVFVGMALVGLAICGIAAAIATNRYLRGSYEDMFN